MRVRAGGSAGSRAARRAGFTALEVLIALSLIGLVIANVVMVMDSSTKEYHEGVSVSEVEFQTARTMDRIALAVMGSSLDNLIIPQEMPNKSSSLKYRLSLGFVDGQEVFSEQEEISLGGDPGQVIWAEKPDEPDERSVVWTNWVREYLEGEVANGVDDNGNGIIDESGLMFTFTGNLVTIALTLERPGPNGNLISNTLQTQVTVRN